MHRGYVDLDVCIYRDETLDDAVADLVRGLNVTHEDVRGETATYKEWGLVRFTGDWHDLVVLIDRYAVDLDDEDVFAIRELIREAA